MHGPRYEERGALRHEPSDACVHGILVLQRRQLRGPKSEHVAIGRDGEEPTNHPDPDEEGSTGEIHPSGVPLTLGDHAAHQTHRRSELELADGGPARKVKIQGLGQEHQTPEENSRDTSDEAFRGRRGHEVGADDGEERKDEVGKEEHDSGTVGYVDCRIFQRRRKQSARGRLRSGSAEVGEGDLVSRQRSVVWGSRKGFSREDGAGGHRVDFLSFSGLERA